MALPRGTDAFSGAIVLVVAAAGLFVESRSLESFEHAVLVSALVCLLAVPPLVILAAPGGVSRTQRAMAVPALLAPLTVCFPWTAAPSHFGVGFGGFRFFLAWLTKYPNWGSINHEVLIGILCVLGCAFLPWLSATLALRSRATRLARGCLVVLVLIAYVPVLVRLDMMLVAAGAVARLISSQLHPPIWVVFGPVLRLASILSMGAMLLGSNCSSSEIAPKYDTNTRDDERK